MKITDGKRMMNVEMKVWDKDSENWGCDISDDYFGNFSDIRYDNEPGCDSVALVHDLADVFDLLDDWQHDDDDEERIVHVSDVTTDDVENLACVMRHSGTWHDEHLMELCKFAGMEDDYMDCDEDETENVIAKAVEKLDVNIDWDGQNL